MRRLLCMEQNPPIQAFIDCGLVPKCIQILKERHDLPKLQFEAAWCLTNVASGNREHVETLVKNKVLDVFVQHLKSPYSELVEQVIWGFGNISGDGTWARDIVLISGAAEIMASLLD